MNDNLFTTIVKLWKKHFDSERFIVDANNAINNASEEDKMNFFKLDGAIAAEVMKSTLLKNISEKVFYLKVLEINVNKHLAPILTRKAMLLQNSEELAKSIKEDVEKLSWSKPMLEELSEYIQQQNNEEISNFVLKIVDNGNGQQKNSFKEIRKMLKNELIT